MKNLYNKLKEWLLAQKNKDSLFSDTIRFLYNLFSNGITEAIITIIGTVLIALLIGIQYFGPFFWIVIGIYVVSVLLMGLARIYQQERIKDISSLKQSLLCADAILCAWANRLQNCAKSIYDSSEKNLKSIKREIREINFQNAAFFVCENLARHLTRYYEDDNIYVTVYQKYLTDDNKEACKMIAYSGNHKPSSFWVEYEIPEYDANLYGTIEYHTYLFSLGNNEISVLCDRDEIKEAFVQHQENPDREEQIQQYIGIPIAIEKSCVTFLLQVDTNIPFLFGKDKYTVNKFSRIAIYPFAQFLHMVYEEARTIDQIIGGIEKNENKN